MSDEELEWINGRLSSRGRECKGRPPLEAYPGAKQPRRLYTPERELEIFSLERVYRYLAERHWWRRVSKVGQISIGSHRYSAGMAYAYQDVKVSFDADTVEFVVEDSQGKGIRRLEPKVLTIEEITGLGLEPG